MQNEIFYSESDNDQFLSILKGVELLKSDKSSFQENSKHILNENIDITAFLVWFIESFPKSIELIKKDYNFQDKFINR